MSIKLALAAMHAAADMLRRHPSIAEISVDNDGDSGEIIFTTVDGDEYVLRLQALTP